MCVWMKFERVFSMHLSPAPKCLSPVRNAFVSSTKGVNLQHNKRICLLFESWFRNPQKKDTMEKSFCATSFQVGMDLKKVQKQGRDQRTQEHYPTPAVYFCRCRVVFLHSFISALFLYSFQVHPYLKWSFTETFSLSFK